MNNTSVIIKTEKNMFIKAKEVSETLDISRAYAYKIVRQLNDELAKKGYMVIDGRTSRKYFDERFYGKVC